MSDLDDARRIRDAARAQEEFPGISPVPGTGVSAWTPMAGGRLAWRVFGAGTPLVLLHGSGGSWRHFIRNIPVLARTHRVLVPDLPGFGDSDLPVLPTSTDALAECVDAGLRSLVAGDEPLDVVGFSFGSAFASRLTRRNLARVRHVVFIGSRFADARTEGELELRRWRNLDDPLQREAALRHNLGTVMIADPAAIDAQALDIYAGDLLRSRLDARPFFDYRVNVEVARGLDVPALVIFGERDAYLYPDAARQADGVREYLPQSRFELIPGAGHWLMYEAAERCNALLADFLAG
ncbi:MAG: alpha/beta fold hydrolase [Gammaproteobacteria bacterium]